MPMTEAIINSSRASPTPEFGRNDFSKAVSGVAMFIIIFVFGSGIFFTSCSIISNFKLPLNTIPSEPVVSTVIVSPVLIFLVAFPEPTIAGMPSSRETIAACEVLPPLSVTIAAAIFIIGSQSGSVISVIKTSPCLNLPISLTLKITRAFPIAILLPTEAPRTRTILSSFRIYSLIFE